MAKYPTPGRVKTRLARAIGVEAACDLYRAFVLDLAEHLEGLGCPVAWVHWPPDAPFAALVPGAECHPQRGRDLGERLGAAVDEALGRRPVPVLVIGADAPHLPRATLEEGARALREGADVVLGPTADGGYYLVGLRRPVRELFVGISWSTSAVLDQTLARAAALGLRPHLLAPSFDVDGPEDLQALRDLLGRGEVTLPRTAALLTELPAR